MTMPINIYMTSFFRLDMTLKSIKMIHDRTEKDSFSIHVFDNGSDIRTQHELMRLLEDKLITSLHLDSRNTGCLYNKGIFYMMNEYDDEYFVVTDNDIYPPRLDPDWLSQMKTIMDNHTELGMLAPQLPPQRLQMPYKILDDIVLAKAIGNTFKIVRKKAFPLKEYKQTLNAYGDDGLVSHQMIENGWLIAFCRNIFCFHAGQCKNWGYEEEQIHLDPRKKGYSGHFTYKIKNGETYEPLSPHRM